MQEGLCKVDQTQAKLLGHAREPDESEQAGRRAPLQAPPGAVPRRQTPYPANRQLTTRSVQEQPGEEEEATRTVFGHSDPPLQEA